MNSSQGTSSSSCANGQEQAGSASRRVGESAKLLAFLAAQYYCTGSYIQYLYNKYLGAATVIVLSCQTANMLYGSSPAVIGNDSM